MITVNYRDPRPVYEQIMDGLRRRIISGVLAPDERLPSVRELAAQLAINPNTIQRAYRELEQSGYIYSVAGKGNFAGHRQEVDAGRRETLLRTLRETARELRWLGVSREELTDCLREQGGNET
ncbi:MAG: GntR family transcriptional regulator [Oscillospiraceae bacterium]|nr:GntR family transcriptional regulator [Oscillospiraceae bacterium]MBR3861892.1 GntR family transcriptional regulator [Oscillospiraceae bacterium]